MPTRADQCVPVRTSAYQCGPVLARAEPAEQCGAGGPVRPVRTSADPVKPVFLKGRGTYARPDEKFQTDTFCPSGAPDPWGGGVIRLSEVEQSVSV